MLFNWAGPVMAPFTCHTLWQLQLFHKRAAFEAKRQSNRLIVRRTWVRIESIECLLEKIVIFKLKIIREESFGHTGNRFKLVKTETRENSLKVHFVQESKKLDKLKKQKLNVLVYKFSIFAAFIKTLSIN